MELHALTLVARSYALLVVYMTHVLNLQPFGKPVYITHTLFWDNFFEDVVTVSLYSSIHVKLDEEITDHACLQNVPWLFLGTGAKFCLQVKGGPCKFP